MSKAQFVIGGIIVLVLAVVSVIYFSSPRGEEGPGEEVGPAEELESQVLTIAGKVTEVNTDEGYLIFEDNKTQESFKVITGEGTSFVSLVKPADVEPGASFSFVKKEITLSGVEVGKQGFISASQPIKSGKDIVNPKEVKILP